MLEVCLSTSFFFLFSTRLQSQLEEARQCIADCSQQEVGSNQLEEWETADDALERATAALIDLIEELQAADESQHHTHKAMRQSSAATIKALRQELGAIKAKISA
jgi:DNA-binding transcriptional regulator YiaG